SPASSRSRSAGRRSSSSRSALRCRRWRCSPCCADRSIFSTAMPMPAVTDVDRERRLFLRLLGAGAAAAGVGSALAREGVDVGPPSVFTNAVPAEQIERAATGQYAQLLAQSRGQGKLASASHPQLKRLRVIASRIIPFTYEWNPRARQWKWEVNLLESPQVNAFCMPGGKIAFFYGILDRLKLS